MLSTDDLKSALKQQMKEWETVQDDEIVFVRLSGLTNITYRVSHANGLVAPVVFKKFGNVEGLV